MAPPPSQLPPDSVPPEYLDSAILNAALDAIITIDQRGRIVSANPATETLFGYPPNELLGENVSILMPSPYREEHDSYLENYHRTRQPKIIGTGREVTARRKDGSIFPADLAVSEVKGQGLFIGIVRDITDRKEAQDARQNLGEIIEESVNEVYIFDADTLLFLQVNRGGRENLGYSMEELRSLTPIDIKPEFDRRRFERLLLPLRERTQTRLTFQSQHRRRDQSLYDVDVHLQLTTHLDRPCFVAMILDTTERRELEQEVVKAAEEERQRIAHDLHDDLGSLLTGIKLRSEGLTSQLADHDPQLETSSAQISDLVRDAITKTRSIARGLRPVGEDPEDLMGSLQALCDRTSASTTFSTTFGCPTPLPVDDPIIANHLYRIAQEAITNAVRSSGGTTISVTFKSDRDRLELKISDDGCGYDEHAQTGSGLGLHIMKYRADAMNGDLHIESSADRGTAVTCTVPYSAGS